MLRARSAKALRRSSELCFELGRPFSSLSPGVQDGLRYPTDAVGQLAKAVSKGSALVVTRDVEYAQIILGFEQCQHYSVRDQHGDVVALLAEEHGGLGTTIGRQMLRSRRSFKATILSPDGTVIFKMRRPAYLISSTMFIEDADDERIGEVQQEWRPLRRCYNLFLGNEQYARIDSPFLAWEFVLRDAQGAPLALIDRNFSGFAKEIFSDAGRYCIHFGQAPDDAARFVQRSIDAHANTDTPKEQLRARVVESNGAIIPFSSGEQLVVKEPLDFNERLIALAAAISIDYDYFSRHSYAGGMLSPFIPIPMPVPPVAADAEVATGAGADGNTGASSDTRGDDTDGGASYGWGGFDKGSATSGSETPTDDFGGDLGSDFGETGGFEEFDDFGAAGEEVASGGLFDLLKDFMSDE